VEAIENDIDVPTLASLSTVGDGDLRHKRILEDQQD
jgi:hypothetical protein